MRILAETATLADAVNKAARIAPVKGPEFFRAAGLLFELQATALDEPLVLKSTDLEVAYRQRVPVLEIEGEGVWRLPSMLLAGILSTLPLGTGHTVELELLDAENAVRIKAGRTKAKLRLMRADEFPDMPYSVEGTPLYVDGFAQLVSQVAWACAPPPKAPVAGVHIDGERLIGLDGKVIAVVPCKIPVEAPITVPLTALAGLIKTTSQVGLIAHDERLYLMPDDDTQASTVIYAAEYPKVDNALRDNFSDGASFQREELEQAVSRMMVLVKGEKYPLVHLVIDPSTLALQMDVPEIGLMEDEIDLTDCTLGTNADPFEIWFTPQDLLGALNAARKPVISVAFGPKHLQSISITDGSGFRCDVMPRHVVGGVGTRQP